MRKLAVILQDCEIKNQTFDPGDALACTTFPRALKKMPDQAMAMYYGQFGVERYTCHSVGCWVYEWTSLNINTLKPCTTLLEAAELYYYCFLYLRSTLLKGATTLDRSVEVP